MADFTTEQQKAMALANARARAQAATPEPSLESGGPLDALSDAAYNVGDWVNEKANKYVSAPIAAALGTIANVGTQAIPMVIGGGIGSKAEPLVEGLSRWFMGKALNPTSKEWASGKGARAVDTMLNEGKAVGANAVNSMKDTLSDLGQQVDQAIAKSPKVIDRRDITSRLSDALRNFENRPNAAEIPAELSAKAAQFENHPLIQNAQRYSENEIPIQEAQRLKQGYQAAVGDKGYGELKTVDTEADKAIARALRTEIGAAEPSVMPILSRESDLINAAKIAQRRAFRQTGVNPLPLGASIATIAHDPTAAVGMFANSSPYIQSQLARALMANKRALTTGAGALVGEGAGAYSGYKQ